MARVYSENFMSDDEVREWCRKFKDGRVDDDEVGKGWKSVAEEDLVERVDRKF